MRAFQARLRELLPSGETPCQVKQDRLPSSPVPVRGIGQYRLELERAPLRRAFVNYASNAGKPRSVRARRRITALGAHAEIFGASIARSEQRQALVDFTLTPSAGIDLL